MARGFFSRLKHMAFAASLAVLAVSLPVVSLPAGAQTADGCDSRVYESMKAQAMLQGIREYNQAVGMVSKPDSVLEYTCFPQFLPYTGTYIAAVLTENQTSWGPVPGMDPLVMDRALEAAVGRAVGPYLQANFSHTYLGGRLTADPAVAPAAPLSYTCDRMAFVWQVAKCWNFMTKTQEGFFSFEQYRDMPDVRRDILQCTEPRWAPLINVSMSGNAPWYPEYSAVTQAVYRTVATLLAPGTCLPPLSTGIRVVNSSGVGFNDGVCLNPGCFYNGAACVPQ